ncbi:acetolactate decarboxylase [Ruficoccus sp. ZRK36]|uniref:acetolactate decarboxylase n=1 Tax=Ruficoccus sp. ZRK36 TaxID=2866311 RepID=UPI001C72DE94|nr:acetolactate decarboxylase [Ruficoccus sp. ZRK36]QYY34884.1 acetolactate decarboxylase [Ruficoccus sp. ZRK36]
MKALLALALLVNFSPLDESRMTQYSTIDAFLAGTYNGELTVGELKKMGDFGLGTFNQVDGELFMLDGEVTHIRALGNPVPATDDMKIPFVAVCNFDSGKSAKLEGPSEGEAVRKMIEDRMFKIKNTIYAIKIEGTFAELKARVPRKLSDPSASISEITETQSMFTWDNVEGTMIGFWCPKYIEGINVSGWHMHFLSKDKTRGGHVLDFKIGTINVSVMELMGFDVILPREPAFYQADLSLDRAEIRTKIEEYQGVPHHHP